MRCRPLPFKAIELARRTASIARQNLSLSLACKLVAIPFAVSGALSPAMAALAMLASSRSVALNSLCLGEPSRDGTWPRRCDDLVQHSASRYPLSSHAGHWIMF